MNENCVAVSVTHKLFVLRIQVRANLPDSSYFLEKSVPGRSDVRIIKLIASGNDGLLFLAESELLKRSLACKIIPRQNLKVGPSGEELWRAEVHKADALRNQAVVKFEDIRQWEVRWTPNTGPETGLDKVD